MREPSKPINIRIPVSLYDKLEETATKYNWSISDALRYYLIIGINEADAYKPVYNMMATLWKPDKKGGDANG